MNDSIFKSFWKSIVSVIGIMYLSFAPSSEFKKFETFNIANPDKIAHILIYLVFTIILITDYNKYKLNKVSQKSFIFICFVMPILFGGFIEIAQETWFKPRSAEWIDWLADIIGATLAIIIMHYYKKYRPNK